MASVVQQRLGFGAFARSPVRAGVVAREAPVASGGLAVRVSGVSRTLGGREVVRGLELSIEPGEFVAIVGRSGTGKSTLLRLLAGLDASDGGQVLLGGRAAAAAGGDVRMMFQDGRLLPWRRVRENVALGLRGDDRDRADTALEAVGLADRGTDWPRALSGGQRQRVALARALAAEPRLVLLDEPLGALDALTRLEMQELIENLWRARGFTAVLVTHDVNEAVRLADRVLLIEGGVVGRDFRVGLSRPRRAGAEFAEMEQRVLGAVLAPGSGK